MRCLMATMSLCIILEGVVCAQRAVLPLTKAEKLALLSPQLLAVALGNGWLIVIDTQGNYIYETQLTEMGVPSCMEVAEGVKLVLFYRERQEMVVMDWKLAGLAVLNLQLLDRGFVEGVCAGTGSTVWILPSGEYKLEKYSYEWRKELEGPVVSRLAEATLNRMCMKEGNGQVAIPTGNGLLIFDQGGTLLQTITTSKPFDGIVGLTAEGVWLWVSSSPHLILVDSDGIEKRIELPGYPSNSTIVDAATGYGLVVVASPHEIFLYSIEELKK